ncbi:hypothetical protein [Massilia sp. PWRC2]|uniref:hypothetical protein n=1 Tax=Massilia sp. PWRC2 TaxID=2804626 RepID=UPI003CF341F2
MSARQRNAAFQAFSWLPHDLRNDNAAVFAVRIKDLGAGVQTCLQLIETSELEREHIRFDGPPAEGDAADVPLLSVTDTSILLRLAITIAGVISEQAEQFCQASEDRLVKARSAATSTGVDHE